MSSRRSSRGSQRASRSRTPDRHGVDRRPGTMPPEPVVTATASEEPTAEPAALVVSHLFDAGPAGSPRYDATIRVTGHRRGADPRRQKPGDSFSVSEVVSGVAPGSGRIAATSWVYGIAPGEWDVTAELVGPERARQANGGGRLRRARWSWRRWALDASEDSPVATRWAPTAPLATSPGVVPGSFTILAAVALVTAIALEPAFLAHHRLDVPGALAASILGVVLGLAGAKAWYMALKGFSRQTLREGWSVDGFLVAAPVAASVVALAVGEPLGAFLDAVAPGLFVAVAIGRVGCFLTGCCAGRTTAGWGICSSDRRVTARRIPTQLLESLTGAILAIAATALVLNHLAYGTGLVFAATIVAYAAARQGLLRLRAESRPFSWRRARPTLSS